MSSRNSTEPLTLHMRKTSSLLPWSEVCGVSGTINQMSHREDSLEVLTMPRTPETDTSRPQQSQLHSVSAKTTIQEHGQVPISKHSRDQGQALLSKRVLELLPSSRSLFSNRPLQIEEEVNTEELMTMTSWINSERGWHLEELEVSLV